MFARDQQTIVIGGLTSASAGPTAPQKVPLLGDIPVLGFLFRNTQKTVEKQNIILALTPYVIHEPADLARVLEAKIRDRREFIRLYGTREERRLVMGPLGVPQTPGMLERINRALREVDQGLAGAGEELRKAAPGARARNEQPQGHQGHQQQAARETGGRGGG